MAYIVLVAKCSHGVRFRQNGWVTPLAASSDERPDYIVRAVAVFGDERRNSIVRALAMKSPMFLGEIEKATGIAQPTLHGHLRKLEDMGYVEVDLPRGQRRGRSLRYSLARDYTAEQLRLWIDWTFGDRIFRQALGLADDSTDHLT